MHLVQLLLPIYDNAGKPLPKKLFVQTRQELFERFGGLTAYSRAPASGLWESEAGHTAQDDIVVYEVMTEELDEGWWRRYRGELELRFAQDALVIRSQLIRML